MIKQRNEAHKLARTSKSLDDWKLFTQLRNKVVNECRKAKKIYLELRLDNNKSDPKRMWGSLKELLKGNSFSNNIYKEVQIGDTVLTNICDMANIFNKYFVDSIPMIRDDGFTRNLVEDGYTESIFEEFCAIDVK